MNYIIFDLEAACREHRVPMDDMEIIEIGAVRLGPELIPCDEFSFFVRPVLNTQLSDFCKNLTGIRQEQVDKAEDFKAVFPQFLAWIGPGPVTLCSWGNYDIKQITIDCARHGLPFPESFKNHINLKTLFAGRFSVKPCGMRKALEKLGLPLDGAHHRGIDDARNIAKIAQILLKS
ncbi:MAG: exonuclease domain-containing protein [Elusimicrobia bacterium]|nr:exonuclease domain-containing protein [Elusimicrobiota bacterium]